MIKNYFSAAFNKDRRKYTIVFIIGVLLRIAVSIWVIHNGSYNITDTESYLVPAKSFIESGKFFVNGEASLLRTPVYPFFLSVCLLIAKDFYYIPAIIIQQLLGIAVYFIWKKLVSGFILNDKIQFVLCCIYLLNFVSIYYGCVLVTDFMFQIGLILLCYILQKYWKNFKVRYMVYSGILLGLLALLRPVAMFLPFALFAGISFIHLLKKKETIKNILKTCVLLVCALAIMGSWALRNYCYTGVFTVSNISDVNLYAYNSPAIEAELTGRSYYDINAERIAAGLTDERLEYAKSLISEHKLMYLEKYAFGIGLQFIYPGINDCFASIDALNTGIQDIKQILTGSGAITVKLTQCISYCFTSNLSFTAYAALLALDVLLLAIITIAFIISFFIKNEKTEWYEKWMLIGIVMYFAVCCGAPVGYGAYPRFRIAFIYPVLICGATAVEKIILKRSQKKKNCK